MFIDYTDTTIQPDTTGDAPEEDQNPLMTPYIMTPPHDPFPMALVNREPYGGEYQSESKSETWPDNFSFKPRITAVSILRRMLPGWQQSTMRKILYLSKPRT